MWNSIRAFFSGRKAKPTRHLNTGGRKYSLLPTFVQTADGTPYQRIEETGRFISAKANERTVEWSVLYRSLTPEDQLLYAHVSPGSVNYPS